jgi:predicted small lipoprotein YifL
MQTVKTYLIILICVALLGACGHKGPLYLPEEEPAVDQESAAQTDTDKENEKAKKDNSLPRE